MKPFALAFLCALAGAGGAAVGSAEESKCVSRVQWAGKCFELVEIGCDLDEFRAASKAWATLTLRDRSTEQEPGSQAAAWEVYGRRTATRDAAEERWRRVVKACAP